jgi:hypothetical protein
MRPLSLLFVTLFTLVLTWVVLGHTARSFASTNHRYGYRNADIRHGGAHDPLDSEAGRRWRQCQPMHWRACLLQQ